MPLQAIYISAELSRPARQLPLAINTALPTIILCFLAANASYYVLLPWDVVSTTDSVAVVSLTLTTPYYPHRLHPSLTREMRPDRRP